MSEPRLKAKLMVHALLRRCSLQAIPALVASKGDEDAGAILVRVWRGGGYSQIYSQTRDMQGRLGWMLTSGSQLISDEKADAYVQRAKEVDYDLWVLDIDSPNGHVPFIHESDAM